MSPHVVLRRPHYCGSHRRGRFTTHEEAQSFLFVVQNIQTRIAEIQTNLAECGLIAGGTATAETDTEYDFVGTGADDGIIFGKASTDPIGFWGITPCDQPGGTNSRVSNNHHVRQRCPFWITRLQHLFRKYGISGLSMKHLRLFSVWWQIFRLVSRQIQTNLAEVGVIAGGTAVVSTTSTSQI